MAKYVYPAIFTPEKEGGFSVRFPDLDGCYTCGDDLGDAIFMAEDVLPLFLCGYEDEKKTIPVSSDMNNIALKKKEFVNYIRCDTLDYRKKLNTKSIKKTLTIPEWLNEEAMAAGVNFSQVLQEALKEKLQLA